MYRSEAFRRDFIVRRNEIQARAIDSLLKTTSVLRESELLICRVIAGDQPAAKMGYVLRPVMVSGQSASRKMR